MFVEESLSEIEGFAAEMAFYTQERKGNLFFLCWWHEMVFLFVETCRVNGGVGQVRHTPSSFSDVADILQGK